MPHLLTVLILLPFVGALALVLYSFAPPRRDEHYRWIALVTTVATFVMSLLLLRSGGATGAEFRFEESVNWIGSIGARYHVAVDGVSLWLVLLTTLLMPIAVLSSWTSIKKRPLAYYAFLLVLESAMIGVFVSLDLLLFYLFFEATLVPMFFLIGIWGGDRRIYAAIKFFVYTAVGSLLMLVGIIALYFIYHTFDYPTLLQAIAANPLAPRAEILLFAAFALAFCIKVPLFPFHTWLPDAHTEAPTAGSVILAGVLLKMGTYGLLRFNLALFPDSSRRAAWIFITLAVIGRNRNHLRRACCDGPTGRQASRRLFISQSHGFRRARPVLVYRTRHAGRPLPDAKSRCFHGRAVPFRRIHLRTASHAPD
jgi:NADH-quinone oxidoreductase subunit M